VLSDLGKVFRDTISELSQDSVRDITTAATIVCTEGIASIERLAFEMYTGNQSIRPARLWNSWNLLDRLNRYGWPMIEKDRFNLIDYTLDALSWPQGPTTLPWFCQSAGLRHHYGEAVASHQELTLGLLLIQNQYHNPYKSAQHSVNFIVQILLSRQYFNYLQYGLEKLRRDAPLESNDLDSSELSSIVSKSRSIQFGHVQSSLSNMFSARVKSWTESDKPLKFKYVIFILLGHTQLLEISRLSSH
jgi:hypothetical protein